ncbi:MAG: hypothetical protein RLZZ42_27 [Bacteroidota bacterium]
MRFCKKTYALLLCLTIGVYCDAQHSFQVANIEFWGNKISFKYPELQLDLVDQSINSAFDQVLGSIDGSITDAIEVIRLTKKEQKLSDWLTYQLIRKCANAITPKEKNFNLYTLTKAVLLEHLGYTPLLCWEGTSYLLYVKSEEEVFNLPIKMYKGDSYVCINHHDFNFTETIPFSILGIQILNPENGNPFKFSISTIPVVPNESANEKIFTFQYRSKIMQLPILVNPEVRNYFTNYPATSYATQFNIPLNELTRQSLTNNLKKKLVGLTVNEGVELLLSFTRTAFDFANDTEIFGREKRLTPEETLLYDKSDCEDRAALFFYLVKEIYNLPMVVLSYPDHVNVGVALDGKGFTVNHQNRSYTVCEPTPQKKNLPLGKLNATRKKQPFEIAYSYLPSNSTIPDNQP